MRSEDERQRVTNLNPVFGTHPDHDHDVYRLRVQFRGGGSLIERTYINDDDHFQKDWTYYARPNTPALIDWVEYTRQRVVVRKTPEFPGERFVK